MDFVAKHCVYVAHHHLHPDPNDIIEIIKYSFKNRARLLLTCQTITCVITSSNCLLLKVILANANLKPHLFFPMFYYHKYTEVAFILPLQICDNASAMNG